MDDIAVYDNSNLEKIGTIKLESGNDMALSSLRIVIANRPCIAPESACLETGHAQSDAVPGQSPTTSLVLQM
ncbi:MAG: hypothetical protein R3F53_25235 [Gammaproteobacteria bacterium]